MFEDKDLRIPGLRPGIKLQNIQKSQQEFLVSSLSQDQLEINILGKIWLKLSFNLTIISCFLLYRNLVSLSSW